METLIFIAVETKTWTEGNHAWFDAKLKPNNPIEFIWGFFHDEEDLMYFNSILPKISKFVHGSIHC